MGMFGFYYVHCPSFHLWFYLHLLHVSTSQEFTPGIPGGTGCAPGRTECGGGAVAWFAGTLTSTSAKGEPLTETAGNMMPCFGRILHKTLLALSLWD